MKSIILRFRDMVTEEGGTISDHMELIHRNSEAWWGWWMKPYETPPSDLFKEIAEQINMEDYYQAYLFNSGTERLYEINIVKIIAAPRNGRIGTPDFQKSPTYYHRGSFPAWFLLSKIKEISIADMNIEVVSFPTIETSEFESTLKEDYSDIIGRTLTSLATLRKTDVTMWEIFVA